MTSGYVCTSCGAACAADTHEPKCRCGGLFELDFTPPAWDPARIDRSERSIFRYRDFMAVDGDVWRSVTMGEGMTLVSHMLAIGVRTCVQDSSGNAGNSVAAYAARAGIACEIYVPEGTSPKKITMIESHGAKVHVVPGTRDHCADVCRAQVAERGAYYANHVYNPYFYEGVNNPCLKAEA